MNGLSQKGKVKRRTKVVGKNKHFQFLIKKNNSQKRLLEQIVFKKLKSKGRGKHFFVNLRKISRLSD